MSEPVVLYEERGRVAIVTLNRPDKMNTLTEDLVQGVADAIDRATASRAVRSIVLRGAGRALTGGYDLNPSDGEDMEKGWGSPFDAPGPKPRAGAWDPVRDLQFMGHNVKRFMKIWECPKPVLGQVHGWAIGGATDLILCCDLLYMAEDAFIGYAPFAYSWDTDDDDVGVSARPGAYKTVLAERRCNRRGDGASHRARLARLSSL
jgi:enoyl-CoA hydratase/carnithine racemase